MVRYGKVYVLFSPPDLHVFILPGPEFRCCNSEIDVNGATDKLSKAGLNVNKVLLPSVLNINLAKLLNYKGYSSLLEGSF